MIYKLDSRVLPSVRLIDTTLISPPYVHRKRQSPEYIIYVINKGEMFLRENGESLVLRSRDVILLDPHHVHEGEKSSTCEYYYIHFLHDHIERENDDLHFAEDMAGVRSASIQSNIFSYERCGDSLIGIPRLFHFDSHGDFTKLKYLLDEAAECNRNPLENYKLLCACKIQEALILLSRCFLSSRQEIRKSVGDKAGRKVEDILFFLNNEFNGEITGRSLEEKFDGNFDYMNRIFKRVTGTPIFHYLTKVRINHARELLLNTSLSVSAVGRDVGFPDEYYFSRVFKKSTGFSPTNFVKQNHSR